MWDHFEQEPAPFWMVYRPAGGEPTMQHEDFDTAMAEAVRIARKHADRVYVLKAVGYMATACPPVMWRRMYDGENAEDREYVETYGPDEQ